MKIHALTAAALFGVMVGSFAAQAYAEVDKKVVHSEFDSVVQTRTGSCVRTRWQANGDPCAPPAPPPPPVVQMAPPPAPPPPPPPPPLRTVILKDERTVYFEFNKANLTPEAMHRLDQLAVKLQGAKDIQRAEIVGFADRMGSKSYNYALSAKRAKAVDEYIHQRGYLSTHLADIRAVGKDEAAAECGDKKKRTAKIACNAPDRKVEVEIVYTNVTR